MISVTVRAPAKINLSLRITAVRRDGFHDIQTLFQTIDLHDSLTLRGWRGPFAIRCTAPAVPTDRANLVWQAAERLWAAGGRRGAPNGILAIIDKRIPMQAGLGGGSSDAAAALLALNRVWKMKLSPGELHDVAAQLGSDVPYFLVGGTALGLGRGEEVYPLEDLPRLWVVLARPAVGVATRDAYGWWDQQGRLPRSGQPEQPNRSLLPPWLQRLPLGNDFEEPVFERHPVVGHLKMQLQAAGAMMAAMSGSGSTVYGVFAGAASARSAAGTLTRWAAGHSATVEVHVTRFRQRTRR